MKWIIVIGFFVHLVFLASIFDIYFKSPVVTGVTPRQDLTGAPAKRLVLFVSDGLRADSLYSVNNEGSYNTPYLRSIIKERGTWGVSHTRVPTESRPGHVALIAGLYEDPSAVARGWQENPVDFDSIFNRSQQTWSWGSPDILPMFAKGAVPDRVHTYYYSHEEEDFSGRKDTSLLDKWVFNSVRNFLENAKTDKLLYAKVNQEKIVFFLHLLGLDTSGHTHKPNSRIFTSNLMVVDNGIKEMEALFNEFYNHDGRTAYIFTSDHGMTDWGSHGSGSSHETETPFIAWGAGLNGPNDKSEYNSEILRNSPKNWKVDDNRRNDIYQADATPLMAALIGISTPVNSVGSLPLFYLNTSEKYMAEAYLENALQVAEQLKRKIELTEIGILPSLHRTYHDLPKEKIMEFKIDTEKFMRKGQYEDAISLSGRLLKLSLKGLDYYHTYYQVLLLSCISLSFIGWIIYLLCKIHSSTEASERTQFQMKSNKTLSENVINYIFLLIITFTLSLIYLQGLSIQMYIYCSLPILIWRPVFQYMLGSLKYTSRNILSPYKIYYLIGQCILYGIGVEILVLSFFYRYTLSIGIVCIAFWELYNNKLVSLSIKLQWFISCLALVIFPALPIVGRDGNITLLLIGAFIWIAISIKDIYHAYSHYAVFQSIVLILAAIVVVLNVFSTNDVIILLSKIVAWTILGASPLAALFSDCTITTRLSSIVKGFAAPFILLSVGHEPLFLVSLYLNIGLWLKLEHFNTRILTLNLDKISFNESCIGDHSSTRSVDNSDFRRAYLFLFYIVLCFFGTGNIASVSSFDPAWVRCFVSVFAPFTMAALIIAKTLVPFLLVTCYCRAVNVIVRASTKKLFLAVLVFSDLMGLHFLFLVQNRGSWLDIGTSISHYVIMQATVLVLMLLYGAAQLLTSLNGLPLPSILIKRNNLKQF